MAEVVSQYLSMQFLRRIISLLCSLLLATQWLLSQDKIISRRGAEERITTGQILGTTADGAPRIRLADGNITVVQISEVVSIEKEESPEIRTAREAFAKGNYEEAIIAAQKIADQFPGLPVAWVVEAFGIVADSHLALKQIDRASEWYQKIRSAYSATQFAVKADIGSAKIAKLNGKMEDAEKALSEIIQRARSTLRPTPTESQVFADAFFLHGEILEQKEQFNEALASFLSIPALYPENPTLVNRALQRAEILSTRHKAVVN